LFCRGDSSGFHSWKDSLSATPLQWGEGERQGVEKYFHLETRGECFICITGKKCYYPLRLRVM